MLSSALFTAANLLAILYHWLGGVPLDAIFARIRELTFNLKVPLFGSVPPQLLPLTAIVIWWVSGPLFFALVQAYGIEAMGRKPLVMLVTVLLYNAPLVTGEWEPDDLLFLSLLYPLICWRSGTGLGWWSTT